MFFHLKDVYNDSTPSEGDVKIQYSLIRVFLVTIVVSLAVSCSTKVPLPTDDERATARNQVPCVIVLPVQTRVNKDEGVTYQDAAVLEQGAQFMDGAMAEALVGHDHVRVLSDRQFTSLIPEDSGTQIALIKAVGSELKCDSVLMTQLIEYRQRIGGSMGADAPASATFSMRLFSARDGKVIWAGQFKETQQSLMSNIMSFEKAQNRGFKWITVEELVRQGLKEKIEECPYL